MGGGKQTEPAGARTESAPPHPEWGTNDGGSIVGGMGDCDTNGPRTDPPKRRPPPLTVTRPRASGCSDSEEGGLQSVATTRDLPTPTPTPTPTPPPHGK
jgi:hypothetical protein